MVLGTRVVQPVQWDTSTDLSLENMPGDPLALITKLLNGIIALLFRRGIEMILRVPAEHTEEWRRILLSGGVYLASVGFLRVPVGFAHFVGISGVEVICRKTVEPTKKGNRLRCSWAIISGR